MQKVIRWQSIVKYKGSKVDIWKESLEEKGFLNDFFSIMSDIKSKMESRMMILAFSILFQVGKAFVLIAE